VAYWLTIFGYNAPTSDVEAKKLMLNLWTDNPLRELAQIEIIDIKSSAKLKESWNEFIVRQHYGTSRHFFGSYLCEHPRRSCEALAGATLMLKPWGKNRFPKIQAIAELHNWIQPLLEEEMLYEKENEPFNDVAD